MLDAKCVRNSCALAHTAAARCEVSLARSSADGLVRGLLTSDFRLLTSSELWLCGYQKRRPLMTSCEIRSDEIRFEHDSPRVPRCERLPRPILNRCRASKSEAGVAERWVPMQRSSLLTSDFRFRLANPEVCTGYRCRNVTSDFRLCCARAAGRENNNNN